MKDFVKRMIEEHSELIIRIKKLEDYVYDTNNADDKIEFSNKCIQLRAMKVYAEALEARLYNQGIDFEDGQYKEIVGEVNFDKDANNKE